MIAITGGGTGGHLAIAKALAIELKNRGENVIFIGSNSGQDRMWFEHSDIFKFKYFFPSRGVVNKKGIHKFFALFNIIKLAFSCRRIFKEHNISSVISVGGYSSAPASFGAVMFRKKLFIHEQNAVKGKLNSILKPFCSKFFSSYGEHSYDYPIDRKFFNTARVRNELKTILFLGGSQGASFINNLALNLALNLKNNNINIIHQCGAKELEIIKSKYDKMGVEAVVFDFSNEIEAYMQKSDLCISRAGASTLWELCANALPAIFIPYPYAASNHQFYNAKFLLDSNLTKIYKQNDLDENILFIDILNLDINSISIGLRSIVSPNGAKIIVDEILKK
ncbi:UDP-N-acetylglucosamine--N-acetylmuramyl-(pentapeptide) pyrophosphoryl-undecaprenol N-acetylglucosamine transferase [Campylobacter fetus]|uniref:UDP-N-acetylglucosamine--N-acetylmuramyl- (pentapeptide) pyrophosphoryl-undecaprenol N-acetylglucosamine transferase n=1 Tax=Campylobacter fetus TaxID=196 RepID=UPI000818ACCC|nr:UDP-N-acetylglucosamine--N-acetylmuramyl-(pentapeptide) pyrophosphoryl-undecaprenol N-acetylglucosamine transferase [Campylobacter fetus]OCR89822.1 UDP-diphospho-muramoylpentapeptide beta-N-acetylglucosaminyltransferase [Campylobacter fetus subsp. testudinum]OCR93459.1 UDP-diphospho-muramoylpentapeptide beta-N-acetylglucosaminyltransferase [Campylobacter fetus subsp. testudinum]OCS01304.1 UDP-N-acetylglucosamine--N-acetylmuramyl-(pentapeptide) pyrophosphoryl-undecaprenol N-acetylglucosamine t